MHPELQSRFDSLEQRRIAMMDRVRALPTDKQVASPGGKSFSPAEVVQHMMMSEAVSVERMRKLPPSALKGRKPKTTFIYKKVVGDMNQAKQITAPPNMVPKGEVNLDQAAKEWEQTRKDIAVFLEEAGSPDAPVQKFFMFGTMSASDLLTLFEAHHHYHETRFPGA